MGANSNFLLSSFFCVIFTFSGFLNAQQDVKIYFFLLDDCPVTQSYTLKIRDLHTDFCDLFPFIGVFPNQSSTEIKITKFNLEYAIPFATQTDYNKELVQKFGVTITPEVVVYSSKSKKIIYRGRIDNEFADLGKRRRVVTTDELRDVLKFLSTGNEKVFTFTKAIGCKINQNDPIKNQK